ncbi:hypothetical protein [Methylomagnum ishizawai]|uniref:hypothetical protein n=1 Tax=Methylomagnum ishizawai TaxID=1760988 RepID=UPI000F747515|nr:hypothetical protein [Methylomagnum ishizawai]
MHLGNISFLTGNYRRFALAPAYDRLPMRWALLVPGPFGLAEDFWAKMRECARLVGRWSGIAGDAAITRYSISNKSKL